jgi:hypothetical protein
MWLIRTLLVASVSIGASGCAGGPKAVSPKQWQALAKADLDAAHQLIIDGHPGVLDEANPTFRDWMESGYREALQLVPKVFNYDSMLAVVRYYVSGFRDGHLFYSDNVRPDTDPRFTAGWQVALRGNRFVVAATAPDWPAPLPPTGSVLVECDGRSPGAIVREDVAPFEDRRDLAAVRQRLLGTLSDLRLKGRELKRCRFEQVDGSRLDVDVVYQPVIPQQYWDWFIELRRKPQRRRSNSIDVTDGVLWIQAANFDLQPNDVVALERLLDDIKGSKNIEVLVFDTRGNVGGDSGVGDKIFEAATGGLTFDRAGIERLPRTYAEWRVSDVSLRSAQSFVDRRIGQYGDDSPDVRHAQEFLRRLQTAQKEGRRWVEQDAGYRIDREEVLRRSGRLRSFEGKVALLTDSSCVSACLDFADEVRRVPGAVHFGQVTSADSLYIDTAYVHLPTGNGFVIPLKVWRNRLRGDNEALVPDVPLDLENLDEAEIRREILGRIR